MRSTKRSLSMLASDSLEAFQQVGGTEAQLRGEPCQTVGQAEYMGQFFAFSRMLYEMGLPHWDGFDFAEADKAYAEYVS